MAIMSPMELDSNIWGWLALRVGLVICFSPPMICWLIAELRGEPDSD